VAPKDNCVYFDKISPKASPDFLDLLGEFSFGTGPTFYHRKGILVGLYGE